MRSCVNGGRMKQYIELIMEAGSRLFKVYDILQYYKSRGVDACTNFNGYLLNSDMSLDDIYKLITGKTCEEYKAFQKAEHERYQREKEAFKLELPALEKYWIEEGKKFITQEYEYYVTCVPIYLRDIYQGGELDCLKELAEPINNKEYGTAKEILNKQNHSGMSYSLIRDMIITFLQNGDAFFKSEVMRSEF